MNEKNLILNFAKTINATSISIENDKVKFHVSLNSFLSIEPVKLGNLETEIVMGW